MLMCISAPASALTNEASQEESRTVKDILNEYQRKLLASKNEEEVRSSAVNSRQASSCKTPEEETVEELRAAGYEAYNVTASNKGLIL